MSYRNDHDAAIARVDALTHELDQSAAERERLKAERDQLQTEIDLLSVVRPRGRWIRGRAVIWLVAIATGILVDTVAHDHDKRPSPPPPPTPMPALRVPSLTPPPSMPTRAASTPSASAKPASAKPASAKPALGAPRPDAYDVDTLLACAATTRRTSDSIATLTDLRPLRASCRKALESSVRYAAISDEARRLLTRWLELEDRLAPTLAAYNTYVLRDPTGTRYRAPAALRDEFNATLSARNAVLAALPEHLSSH